MRNKKIFDMVILATFLTIIIVLTITGLGYITLPFFPLVSGTIIHIPVLIACIYFGKKIGVGTGLIFGLSSWLYALTRAALPIEFVFRNPIVAIFPRVLFPLIAYYIYNSIKKMIKNDSLNIILTSVISTLIHALLVLPLIMIFGPDRIAEVYQSQGVSLQILLNMVWTTLVFNTILEMVLAGAIVAPIVLALRSANNKFDN
ncbi:MAG TPA: ECF transporter S component [Haloplasmataceae bacterium]